MEYRFGGKKQVNHDKFKIATKQRKSNISLKCILRGPTRYYNAVYILFTYFESCIGYVDGLLEVISNLHFQGVEFDGKRTNLAENLLRIELCLVY